MWTLMAIVAGFIIDLIIGDPHSIPHPVVGIGKLISYLDKRLRALFPKTKGGEIAAGGLLWFVTAAVSLVLPMVILWLAGLITPWLRFSAESIMCWQILAAKSLKDESMKVYYGLVGNNVEAARHAVSMIVGRDTHSLDEKGITKAAVETVAENSSDGVIAPLLFLAIGGAPFGFMYKAINTMDSMLGYVEPPYKNIGLIPARMDDIVNFIPARLSALVILLSGFFIRLLQKKNVLKATSKNDIPDVKNGWKMFIRDRYNHASPNSAQTESMCAGLLRIQLAGDAWYHGVLHKKKFIGDPIREIEYEDIPRINRIMYGAAAAFLVICIIIRALFIIF